MTARFGGHSVTWVTLKLKQNGTLVKETVFAFHKEFYISQGFSKLRKHLQRKKHFSFLVQRM